MKNKHALIAAATAAALSGCGSAPRQPEPAPTPAPRAERPAPKIARAPATSPAPPRAPRGGGYYLDDGPGDAPPPDLDSIPEPVPQLEPLVRGTMRPYVVLGQSFTPMTELTAYRARGIASWYGRRYHGKPTSSGEIYDMYAISAAHPTLPIPSYARVTNVANGRSVVVRVNDRGPFLDNRLIDLSYTAAHRLGVLGGGSALVEVETIIPNGGGGTMVASAPRSRAVTPKPAPPVVAMVPAPAPAPARAPAAEEPDPILAIAAAARDVDPTTPESATTAARETPLDPTGIYLQLGAFGSRENAESYLTRARVQFDWLAERLQVRMREGLYRVHAGPYARETDARQAAERIASSLGVKPVVTR